MSIIRQLSEFTFFIPKAQINITSFRQPEETWSVEWHKITLDEEIVDWLKSYNCLYEFEYKNGLTRGYYNWAANDESSLRFPIDEDPFGILTLFDPTDAMLFKMAWHDAQ